MLKIIYIAVILLLIKIAYIDYKQKIIPDKLNIIVALLGFFNLILNFQYCKIYIVSAVITFAVFLFLAVITDGGIGGGDIKLFTALALIFGTEVLLIVAFTFVLAAVISMMKILTKKADLKESIALAPYICAGTVLYIIMFPIAF